MPVFEDTVVHSFQAVLVLERQKLLDFLLVAHDCPKLDQQAFKHLDVSAVFASQVDEGVPGRADR